MLEETGAWSHSFYSLEYFLATLVKISNITVLEKGIV